MAEVEKEQVNGVEHRLLDGYDGGTAPPEEFLKGLLASAPPEVRARAKEWAQQQKKLNDSGGLQQ